MKSFHTYYENLKVTRSAPHEVIRAAYKSLVQKYHPDLNPNNPDSVRIMKLINEAYEVLSDPVKRKAHDKWIEEQEGSETKSWEQDNILAEKQRKEQRRAEEQQRHDQQRINEELRSKAQKKKEFIYKSVFLSITILGVLLAIAVPYLSGKNKGPQVSNNEYVEASVAAASTAVAAAEEAEAAINAAETTDSIDSEAVAIDEVVLPVLPLPTTGDTDNPNLTGVAPLQIKTAFGDNYFVKIDDAYSGEHLVSYFIRSGQMLEVNLPVGSYTIKYASGQDWYGPEYLFGKDTSYSKADQVFSFQFDGYQYNGYTVELIKQVNGNLQTNSIGQDQF